MSLKRIVIYILLIFPYILDNAKKGRIWDQQFRFFDLPRSVELLYPAIYILSILILIIIQLVIKKRTLKPSPFFKIVLIAFLLSIVSHLINAASEYASTMDGILTINKYYRMFFIYIITYLWFNPTLHSIKKLNKISIFFVGLSVAISWYQIIFLDAKIDAVTGFTSTAHRLVIQFLFFSTFLFYYCLFKKKYFNLLFVAIIIIAAVIASFMKANIIFLLSIFIFYFVLYKDKMNIQRLFSYLFIIIIVIGSLLFLLKNYDYKNYSKIENFTNIKLSNIPYYNNILHLPKLLFQSPQKLVLGYGPGNFGSRTSLYEGKTAVKRFNEIYDFTKRIDTFGLSPSMKNPTSPMLALLLENGIIVFLLYFYLLLYTYKKTKYILLNNNGKIPIYLINSTFIIYLFFILYNLLIPEHIFYSSNLFTGFIFMYLAIIHKRFDLLTNKKNLT